MLVYRYRLYPLKMYTIYMYIGVCVRNVMAVSVGSGIDNLSSASILVFCVLPLGKEYTHHLPLRNIATCLNNTVG